MHMYHWTAYQGTSFWNFLLKSHFNTMLNVVHPTGTMNGVDMNNRRLLVLLSTGVTNNTNHRAELFKCSDKL